MGVVFQLTDLTFISRLGEAPMASVVIVNQSLRQTYFLMIMGLSFGTQALIARAVGEGRSDHAEHVAGQSVVLGALLSLALILSEWLRVPRRHRIKQAASKAGFQVLPSPETISSVGQAKRKRLKGR